MTLRFVLAYLVAVTLAAAPRCASASYTLAEFTACNSPFGCDPRHVGWVALGGISGSTQLASNGQPTSWEITDASTASFPYNPSYVWAFDNFGNTNAANAVRDGWRFQARARYMTDFSTNANLGLSVYLNNRAYHLMLDLDNSDLRATLFDDASTQAAHVYPQLTTGGSGAAGFHDFVLQGTPGGGPVRFLFDGRELTTNLAWDGIGIVHENTILWGNSNQAGMNRGTMRFRSVMFEIGPFPAPRPGDFNGDNVADGADLLKWQQLLGTPVSPAGSGADADGDGWVDADDLNVWKSGFGRAATVVFAAPEPGAANLLAAIVLIGALAGAPLPGRRRG